MKHTSLTSDRLYRVRVVAYPEGATYENAYGQTVIDSRWSPPGWEPTAYYVESAGTFRFYWPSTQRMYWTLKAAKERAALMENYGATVVIEKTQPVQWERHTEPEPLLTAAKRVSAVDQLRERLRNLPRDD